MLKEQTNMDEKELEALFELLQESESGLEDINEARAIIETEGIGTFFPLVEDSFESAEQFQQAFPSLKKNIPSAKLFVFTPRRK